MHPVPWAPRSSAAADAGSGGNVGTRARPIVIVFVIMTLAVSPFAATGQDPAGYDFGTPEFQQVWDRTDLPVEQGMESRTWMWGPDANTPVMQEPYEEADGGMRDVQYTDKSRMEMPVHPVAPDSAWFITQGLLATELMTGEMQLGDATFVQHDPSNAYVAGDPVNNQSPTYAQMGQLMDQPARPTGEVITEVIAADGSISSDGSLAGHGVTGALHVGETDHTIASVFWDFMNSTGTVYANGQFGHGPVFNNPFYAIGFPITEAYWGHVTVGGDPQMVLNQCFERRCLTFTPDNDPGWQVESGNIGQHYYDWRYNQPHYPDDGAADDSPPPATDDSSDDAGTSPEPQMLIVHPDQSEADMFTTYTFAVEVLDGDLEPYPGAQVQAQVTETTGATLEHLDQWLTPNPATTGLDGFAELSYTGTETGVDTISFDVIGTDLESTTQHTWKPDCVTEGQSIQAAIDQASVGDRICVESGIYNESINISTDEISLIGGDNVVLDGGNASLDHGVTISGQQVSLRGFEIRDFSETGISISGDDAEAFISDVHLESAGRVAILGTGEPTAANPSDYELVNAWVSDTTISYGPDDGQADGMSFSKMWFVQISNVAIEGTHNAITFSGSLAGMQHQTPYTVEDSRIRSGLNGILDKSGDGLLIQGNDISADRAAIVLSESEPDTNATSITGNRLGTSDVGVLVMTPGEAIITSNVFESNRDAAVKVNQWVDANEILVNQNDFLRNNRGIQHLGSGAVDASHNFWGHQSGPGGEGPGIGDSISDGVRFNPWAEFPFISQ